MLLLQEPTKIVLGSKLKYKGCGSKRRLVDQDETMVYVSILDTLEKLLCNEAVMAEVKKINLLFVLIIKALIIIDRARSCKG